MFELFDWVESLRVFPITPNPSPAEGVGDNNCRDALAPGEWPGRDGKLSATTPGAVAGKKRPPVWVLAGGSLRAAFHGGLKQDKGTGTLMSPSPFSFPIDYYFGFVEPSFSRTTALVV